MSSTRRGPWVLLLLLLAGLSALVGVPSWITATANGPVIGTVAVRVSGSTAAPGLVGAALVLAAAAVALGLVGRIGRWVVSVVVAAAGVLIVAASLTARSGAESRAAQAAADLTGIGKIDGEVTVTFWPIVAVVLGVLVIVAAAFLLRASAHWPAPSARHERAGQASGSSRIAPPVDDERSTWDALGRGDDPT